MGKLINDEEEVLSTICCNRGETYEDLYVINENIDPERIYIYHLEYYDANREKILLGKFELNRKNNVYRRQFIDSEQVKILKGTNISDFPEDDQHWIRLHFCSNLQLVHFRLVLI